MSQETKISQVKARLLVNYPYFGTIASKLELVLNDDIQSSKSDGIKLEYNSDFFDELTLNEMEFVFANGAMHASLAHDSRKSNRSGWLWQLATDYAINDMLVENGMDRPWQAHYSERFSGLYAEEIYAELKDDILRDELEYDSDEVDDIKESKDENQEEESTQSTEQITKDEFLKEQLFEEFTKATLESESKKGELPLELERFFELDFVGKIDWREELRDAIDIFHKDDYTLIPPNKKFLHLGIYLPSTISNRFTLVIAIDSSGSIDDTLLNEFLSEINFLMQTIQNYQIELLVCDDKIQSHQSFYSGDILECDVIGQGGTDFRPVFEFIESEFSDTQLLLYFTDLDGVFPSILPSYNVKWITQKEKDIPFGEMIFLS